MVKSSFSGKELPPGKGLMYVRKDGRILYFLNKKEEKNMLKLKRKPRTVAWTEEYRKEKGQRIAIAQHQAEAKEEKAEKKAAEKKQPAKQGAESDGTPLTSVKGIGAKTADSLKAAGYETAEQLAQASTDELTQVEGIGPATAEKLLEKVR